MHAVRQSNKHTHTRSYIPHHTKPNERMYTLSTLFFQHQKSLFTPSHARALAHVEGVSPPSCHPSNPLSLSVSHSHSRSLSLSFSLSPARCVRKIHPFIPVCGWTFVGFPLSPVCQISRPLLRPHIVNSKKCITFGRRPCVDAHKHSRARTHTENPLKATQLYHSSAKRPRTCLYTLYILYACAPALKLESPPSVVVLYSTATRARTD